MRQRFFKFYSAVKLPVWKRTFYFLAFFPSFIAVFSAFFVTALIEYDIYARVWGFLTQQQIVYIDFTLIDDSDLRYISISFCTWKMKLRKVNCDRATSVQLMQSKYQNFFCQFGFINCIWVKWTLYTLAAEAEEEIKSKCFVFFWLYE